VNSATAEEPNPVGAFEAPAECVDGDGLRRLVLANSTQPPAPSRRIIGGVERNASGYRFQLILQEGGVSRGQRVLDVPGDDCHREDPALGLVAAMLLEGPPDPAPASEAETPKEPPASPPPPVPAEEEEDPAPADEPPPPRTRFGATAAMGASFGLQPGVAPGVVVGAVVELAPPLDLRATAAYFFPTVRNEGAVGVEVDRFSAGAELCVRLPPRGFHVEGCAGGQALILWALGRGFPANRREDAVFAAFSATARAVWPLSDAWRLSGAAGLLVTSGQAAFVGTDASGKEIELFRSSRVAPQVELGIEWLFN
jgi:hypothetical protein